VLVVGAGFTGTGVAQHLAAAGAPVLLASRRPPRDDPAAYGAGWRPVDATDPVSYARLLDGLRPDRVVLVHGPSDVTWCEAHPAEALAAHATAARVTAAAPGAPRIVLISTDNVFGGASRDEPGGHTETDPPAPANAYGRAKHAAERVLLESAADAVALRVSLVYGHEPRDAGKWLNFAASCAHRLLAGERVEAPHDQWTTPVLLADVAAVTAAVLDAPGPLPPVLHLGGPDEVSRAAWAAVLAEELGADPGLVVPVPRAATRYAARPRHSSLAGVRLGALAATRHVPVRGVRAGARALAPAFRAPGPEQSKENEVRAE
jgi:dTDP-4-dehydrorhamnose reductase